MRLRSRAILAVLAASLVLPVAGSGDGPSSAAAADGGCAGASIAPTEQNLDAVRHATLCLVNAERAQRGLKRMDPVDALDGAATAYARQMVRQRFFDHTAPDGTTFIARVKQTTYLRGGVRGWALGENLAWGSGSRATPQRIVDSWMRSPPHRRNILDPGFDELGVGVSLGAPQGRGGSRAATYVTEFGERHR